MRKSCFDCVIKHLGAAAVAETEYRLGYPKFKLWVVGNLDHAAQEMAQAYYTLAMVIREHRLNWMMAPGGYDIPYEDLAWFVDACSKYDDPAQMPTIPDSCLAGLKLADGNPVFSSDTRP